jgi:AraC-like DNA-binding protein
MTLATRFIAGEADWQVTEVRCGAGPADPPFEERHDRICMAVVLDGTFAYRSALGAGILAPGAVLLGNAGECFECGHRHSVGDRCLSFHFDPSFYERILGDVPGATRLTLDRVALPPGELGAGLAAGVDRAFEHPAAAEEYAHDLAAHVASAMLDRPLVPATVRGKTGRIQELVHWIDTEIDQPLSLADLARRAAMSPYHCLREFRRVVGMTPYQYILARRLRRAAGRLRDGADPILQVALEAGFADLSEFNRRFRRALGMTPGAYRARLGR